MYVAIVTAQDHGKCSMPSIFISRNREELISNINKSIQSELSEESISSLFKHKWIIETVYVSSLSNTVSRKYYISMDFTL